MWATDFQNTIGTRFQFVPYRGAFAIVQDIVGGQIDIGYTEGSNILAHLKGGKLKAYAVHGRRALAGRAGRSDHRRSRRARTADAVLARHLGARRARRRDVIAKLNAAVTHALADPTVRARLAQMGQDIYPREQQTPQALAAHHKAEVEKWGAVIKATGVKAE